MEPIVVGFEQEQFTANEGTMLSLDLQISGPGFGSVPISGGIQSGFDPQQDLDLVLVNGPPVALCKSLRKHYSVLLHAHLTYPKLYHNNIII